MGKLHDTKIKDTNAFIACTYSSSKVAYDSPKEHAHEFYTIETILIPKVICKLEKTLICWEGLPSKSLKIICDRARP